MSEIIPFITFDSTSSTGLETVESKDITVTLSEASNNTVSIGYALTGTATGSGTDYTLANGTLTIAAGQTSGTITIADIVDDTLVEADETVIVTLSNPTNAVLGSDIKTIVSNDYAFAALKEDGSVVAWGEPIYGGGDSSAVASSLSSGVSSIVSNYSAFAALKEDGSVVTWGGTRIGGDQLIC